MGSVMSRVVGVALLAAPASLAACHATEKQLRARAAFDLNCPEDQIQITKIDFRTRGVRACGEQATYVEACQGSGQSSCTWVLNTDSRRHFEP